MGVLNLLFRYKFIWASYTHKQPENLCAFLSNITFILCRHVLLLRNCKRWVTGLMNSCTNL